MAFYEPLSGAEAGLQQGDLLEGVPFCYLDISRAKVRLESGGSTTRDLSRNPTSVLAVVSKVEFSMGLVISQTCDVQPDPATGSARRPILLARVRPIKELIRDFKDSTPEQAIKAISAVATPGRSPTVLYLPPYSDDRVRVPRSGVNLLDVQRFVPADLPALTRLLRLRLTDSALQALQERLAYCFGRFGAPDDLYYSEEEWAMLQSRTAAIPDSARRPN